MKLRRFLPLIAFVLTGPAMTLIRAAAAPQVPSPQVTPSVVPMGTFYGGAQIRVEGTVPLSSQVVVAIRGADVTEVFNKIGKVGPIWVNTGKVSISGIPYLLMIYSSAPLSACLSRAELDRYQLDEDAIKKHIEIKPKEKSGEPVAGDFLKLKTRQKNYEMAGGGIQLATADGGVLPYVLNFTWPRNAAPGNYQISVYACRNGEVKEISQVPLQVVEVGFPEMIASLARERPATYGAISVIVAIIAGFGIDFIATRIFKRKISAH